MCIILSLNTNIIRLGYYLIYNYYEAFIRNPKAIVLLENEDLQRVTKQSLFKKHILYSLTIP
jgi:hypothetical protein